MKKTTLIRTALFTVILLFATVGSGWAATATYTISSKTAVTTSGTAPSGSSATYSQTYSTQGQMIASNSTTLTLSGYAGYKISSIVLSMKSNTSAGAGTLSIVAGSTSISSISPAANFSAASWNGAYSTSYTNVTKTPTAYDIKTGENVVITIAATVNSLYIQSYTITYVASASAPVVTASQSYSPTVGVAFSQQIAASNSPTSYTLASGAFPTGLSMSSAGLVTGTPTAAGSFTASVTATNSGGTSPAVDVAFTVAKGSQSITFGSLPAKTTADADFAPGATSATSGINAISYSSSNTAVATIVSNQIHIVGAGTTTITASQAGNSDYNAATSVGQTLNVTQFVTPQSITFGALSAKTYGDANFDLTATASSGLGVSYSSSNSAVATVSGSTVTIVGPGTTTITASQAGNAEYNPATSVNQDLVVNVKPLTVTGAAVTTKTYDGTVAAVITGTLSGIVGADVVTLTGTGTFASSGAGTGISVTSTSTLGGANAAKYSLTQPTGLTGDINKASQSITFGALPAKTTADADFAPGATSATSGINAISYSSSNTAVATIVSNQIHIVGAGTTTITASQAASANYEAASVGQSLVVTLAPSVLAKWTFASATPGSVPTTIAVSDVSQGNNNGTTTLLTSTSASSGYTGASGSNNAGASARTGTLNTASSGSAYFEFTITPNVGYKTTFTSISFGSRSTSTGPVSFTLRSSADSYASDLCTGTMSATSTWELKSASSFSSVSTSAITYRIYGYGGTGSASANTANWRIDDLILSGYIDAVPTIVSNNSFVTFSAAVSENHPQSISVSGLNLTDNISVALTGANVDQFSVTPSTISQTGGVAGSTTVTVTYTPTVISLEHYATLTLSSPGATSVVYNLIASVSTKVENALSATKIFAAKGSIVVAGASNYTIFNAQGVEVANVKAAGENSSVALRAGIYIVKIAGHTQKVLVK